MGTFNKRLYVFVPIALKTNANNFCKNNWPGGNAELQTFQSSVWQTAGIDSHYGANCAVSAGMVATLAPLQGLAGAFWSIVDNADFTLLSTNIPASIAKIGQVYDFDTFATDAGLTRNTSLDS